MKWFTVHILFPFKRKIPFPGLHQSFSRHTCLCRREERLGSGQSGPPSFSLPRSKDTLDFTVESMRKEEAGRKLSGFSFFLFFLKGSPGGYAVTGDNG